MSAAEQNRGSVAAHPGDPAGAAATAPRVRLKVEQASFAYSPTDRSAPTFTLGPASFEAHPHELVAILGPNASGKSTLLRLLAGLSKPLAGRIEVDGEEVSALDLRTRAKRIALVQQESELLFPLRVWEYVLQGRYPHGRRLRFESDNDCLMVGNALAQVGAEPLRDRWMDQLSGGEKQRVILSARWRSSRRCCCWMSRRSISTSAARWNSCSGCGGSPTKRGIRCWWSRTNSIWPRNLRTASSCCTRESACAWERLRKCMTARSSRKSSRRRWKWKCGRADVPAFPCEAIDSPFLSGFRFHSAAAAFWPPQAVPGELLRRRRQSPETPCTGRR